MHVIAGSQPQSDRFFGDRGCREGECASPATEGRSINIVAENTYTGRPHHAL